jgi:type I restriction enzyme, S subunit
VADWQKVRLGDVAADVTVGFVGSMSTEYTDSGIIFLRSQNITPHRIDFTDTKYIGEDFHRRLAKSALRPGDVVTVRTGKPGTSAVVPSDAPEMNCADLVITRPGKFIDSRWLSYYLNSVTDGFIATHLVGAVQQHFNVGIAKSMELALPPLVEQQAIAEALSALDEKIAVNKLAASKADAVAEALVGGFDRRVQLSRVAEVFKNQATPEEFGAPDVWHYSLPAFDDHRLPRFEPSKSIKSAKFILDRPVVLISKLNPRFPRVWDLPTLKEGVSVASTEFVVLASTLFSSSTLRALLAQSTVSQALEDLSAGTSGSHQRVKPSDVLATEIIDPRGIPESAHAVLTSLGKVAEHSRSEVVGLAEVRNTLLPHLMSGRLRVKDAEKQVEAVV